MIVRGYMVARYLNGFGLLYQLGRSESRALKLVGGAEACREMAGVVDNDG